MAVSMADIKKLRELTGAGMMDVKKALAEAEGDLDKAVEVIRVKGLKGATKREGRTTSEGLIAAEAVDGVGVMIEILCETDFVAKSERFIDLSDKVLQVAVSSQAENVEDLLAASVDGIPVSELIVETGAVLGEKIEVRRISRVQADHVASYLHRTAKDLPPQVGVLFGANGTSAEEAAHDVAVHIAAYAPAYLTREDVGEDTVQKERSIAEETAKNEGKPEAALSKIIEGRMIGFFKECVLLDQPFAKNTKQSVQQVLENANIKAVDFARFRVGEELT